MAVEKSDRIEGLLAQLLIVSLKDASAAEKARHLRGAGFEPSEIARMLGSSSGTVRQMLYTQRKAGKKRKSSKK